MKLMQFYSTYIIFSVLDYRIAGNFGKGLNFGDLANFGQIINIKLASIAFCLLCQWITCYIAKIKTRQMRVFFCRFAKYNARQFTRYTSQCICFFSFGSIVCWKTNYVFAYLPCCFVL